VKEASFASLTPDDVMLHAAPITFDASTFEIWGALLNGARLALVPVEKPSLAELGATLERPRDGRVAPHLDCSTRWWTTSSSD
jgi:hypothetical protein